MEGTITLKETIILSSVAEGIIASLGSIPVKDIVQRWGVEDELERLKDAVSDIKSILPYAEEQQDGNPEARAWLKKLQKPMYDADDLLDDVSSEALTDDVSSEALPEEDKKKKNVFSKLKDHVAKPFKSNQVPAQLLLEEDEKRKKECNDFSKSNQVPHHPSRIGHKMKDIREKLDDIANIATHWKFTLERHPTQIGIKNRKREDDTYSFVLEEDVIGREEDKKKVVALLLEYSNVGKNVSILPIVGIGGLGKTALAKLVFNDQEVQQHFELKMWVCVSDIFDLKIIVENIIESVTGNKQEDVGMEALIKSLINKINGKKYLLVLDDLWNEDREKWDMFKSLLMGGARGSRVLLTTRSEKVAMISKTIEPYLLKGLGEQDSWSLFKKIAFEEGKELENTSIVKIGREIVAKCVNVPLAIRTIGGLLYFKNPETEWLPFMTNELSRIPQNENDILPTLKLSYDKFPSHLKQCFAYCSLFPKDYKFHKSTLIHLWMAQGFISVSNQHQVLEDVGHDYFMHLLWRSFFQDAEVDEFGDVIRCKMHDLMHDLATSVAGSLITTLHSIDTIDEKTRHVSIDSFPGVTTSLSTSTRIRTLLLPNIGLSVTESTCDAISSSFQLLRALDLRKLELEFVPPSIGYKLKHLRNLDLSSSGNLRNLPDSITCLQNLQTLSLSNCKWLEELPRDIKKLVNLRHLEIDECHALKYVPRGLGELTNLQTLSIFVIPSGSVSENCADLSELSRLNNLRGKLLIKIGRHGRDVALQCKAANLKEKKYLRTLLLEWTSESDVFDSSTEDVLFEELEGLQPHPNLKSLSIKNYRGRIFPSWLLSLTNLVELSLYKCDKLISLPALASSSTLVASPTSLSKLKHLSLHSMQDLKTLPNEWLQNLTSLESLSISHCDALDVCNDEDGRQWRGLKSLHSISFVSLPKLVSLPRLGHVTPLQKLCIHDCFKLVALPERIDRYVGTSLVELEIWGCPSLKSLPEGMRGLTSLQRLFISGCSPHFATRFKKSSRISHIPSRIIQAYRIRKWQTHMSCWAYLRKKRVLEKYNELFTEKKSLMKCRKAPSKKKKK